MKKTWEKPCMVVIVRNKPEEGVLSTCKNSDKAGYGEPAGAGCINSSIFDYCYPDTAS